VGLQVAANLLELKAWLSFDGLTVHSTVAREPLATSGSSRRADAHR
jgi:hypothetical protein